MTDVIESGGWVNIKDSTELLLGVSDLAYVNNLGVAFSDNPWDSESDYRKYKCSVNSTGTWSSIKITEPIEYIRVETGSNFFVIAGTFESTLVIYKAYPNIDGEYGFWSNDWEKVYTFPIPEMSTRNSRIKKLNGAYLIPLRGMYFVGNDSANYWNSTKLAANYSSYDIIDVTFSNGIFYFLLNDNNKFAIAYGPNENSLLYYNYNSSFTPAAIGSNNEHIVIIGGHQELFYLQYTDIGLHNEWKELTITPEDPYPIRGESKLTDIVFHNDKWEIVGNHAHWNILHTKLISDRGLIYTIDSDFTNITEHNLQVSDLSRIYMYENKLYALGQGYPNSNTYIVTKE